jgi:hypothetical protein
MRYGPMRGMKPYSKNLFLISALWAIAQDWLCAMGNRAGLGYPLWAVAKDLLKLYGPWRRIWLCAMDHSAKTITKAQN